MPTSLTFTPVNWYLARTVTVSGVNDFVDDGDIPFTIITAAAVSTDPAYNGMNADDVSVTCIDNDTAGITVTPTDGLSVTETGGTATFTVVLNSQPAANVSLELSSSDTGEGTVSPSSLTFTGVNWTIPQTVTVTGVDDSEGDGNITFTINTAAATSDDPAYTGMDASDVSVINIDNDTPGITVIPTSGLSVNEAGGMDFFTVVLNTQPTANVDIGLSSSDTGEGTLSPSPLSFTSSDWSTPQVVTVTGVDDLIDDGDISFTIITADATSGDPDYSGMTVSDVSVTCSDDDTAGITVTPTDGLSVTEAGGTDTFTIVLNTQPTADVSITLSSSDTLEGTVSPTPLTFTDTDWLTPQTVTITGVEDAISNGNVTFTIVTTAATSDDTAYNGMDASDVSVIKIDNDITDITAIPTSGLSVTEAGGTASFTVVLNSQPTADVSVALTSWDTGEGIVSTATLTFTSSDWSIPQEVTITGVDDQVDDGNVEFIISGTSGSSDDNYDGIYNEVSVTCLDDDTAGITATPSSGLVVTEAGGVATFTVKLDTLPDASVTFGLMSSDTSEGTVSPSSLTFTTANWSTSQIVTVNGVDDPIDDGDIVFSILADAAISTDPVYNGLMADLASVTCSDDDANTPPTALLDTYSTPWRTPLNVDSSLGLLVNDSDFDGDPLTAVLVDDLEVEQGTLTLNPDGSFTFIPAVNFSGDASFTYQASDGKDSSTPVTVTIHVVVNRLFLPLIVRP